MKNPNKQIDVSKEFFVSEWQTQYMIKIYVINSLESIKQTNKVEKIQDKSK